MIRCALSVPSNIAEGAARASRVEYAQYVSISLGSVTELQTQLEVLAEWRSNFRADVETLLAQAERIAKMLVKLRQALRK
jgi:four helix bundle protein